MKFTTEEAAGVLDREREMWALRSKPVLDSHALSQDFDGCRSISGSNCTGPSRASGVAEAHPQESPRCPASWGARGGERGADPGAGWLGEGGSYDVLDAGEPRKVFGGTA
ncbi:unnamed protein product, partial [Symbiodinium necroappetens]